jgi:hypothetical protein
LFLASLFLASFSSFRYSATAAAKAHAVSFGKWTAATVWI